MSWMRKFIDIPEANYKAIVDQSYGFRLQPVTDIHLHSRLRWELGTNGNIEYIYILATAALLTLVIAAANFINLTTARSADRAREIGVRKTMGATQRQLSMQFLMESIILALAAAALGMLIAELALPLINAITGTSFAFNYGRHGVLLLALSLLIGTLSGLYPSAWLSAIAPQRVLKGKQVSAPGGFRLQNGLIVFQFAMSMVLISSAVILYHQLNYLREKDPGFDKEALVVIPVKAESGLKRFDVLQHELLQVEGVVAASATSNLPGGQFNQHHLATTAFPEEDIPISEAFVDYDFFRVMDIPFVQGREFMRGNPADSVAFVLNESAVRALNLEGPPVGQEIWWIRHEEGARMRGTVIGVVQDFHFQSLHEHIRPLLFKLTESRFNHIIARVRTENTGQVLDSMKEIYKKFEPVYAFEPAFLEDTLDAQYASEQRMGLVLAIFTGVAIVIACVGLFGISLLTFHHKTRELSIRKVLGADVADILVQVLGAFTRLILIAVGVAIPLAWWIMNQWLENFSYQVSIAPSVFLIRSFGASPGSL